jgi:hypothetical protein
MPMRSDSSPWPMTRQVVEVRRKKRHSTDPAWM